MTQAKAKATNGTRNGKRKRRHNGIPSMEVTKATKANTRANHQRMAAAKERTTKVKKAKEKEETTLMRANSVTFVRNMVTLQLIVIGRFPKCGRNQNRTPNPKLTQ